MASILRSRLLLEEEDILRTQVKKSRPASEPAGALADGLRGSLFVKSLGGGAWRPKSAHRRRPPVKHVVFLRNIPAWVTADAIRDWIFSFGLVCDAVKMPSHPLVQEHRGFAFIDVPNAAELAAVVRRFDGAPLEDPSAGRSVRLGARRAEDKFISRR